MDNQAKIAELKKNINNKFFPEALKPKLKLQIEALQKEINAENDKAKPKQSTNLSFEDWLKSKKIEIYKRTYYWVADDGGKDYMYSGKKTAIMKSLREDWKKEIGSENDKAKQSTKSNVIDYDKMSDEDFAFTLLGKICAADIKAWNETKSDSGSEIRVSEKLTKIYANSLDKSLKDLKVKKNSLTEKEYDYLVDNNYHLLNEFLSWNDFYENDFAKSQKEMYQRLFDDKSNSSSAANPDWITVGKTSTTKILPKSIEILWAEGANSTYDKFPKKYDSFEEANKALIPVHKDGEKYDGGYNKVEFKIVWTDGEEYEGRLSIGRFDNPTETNNLIGDHVTKFLKNVIAKPLQYDTTPKDEYQNLLDNYMFSGSIAKSNTEKATSSTPKKPTTARKVKSELKKYFAHRDIKTVTVIEDGKKVVYKGDDVLNGAQFLAKGGKLENLATYVPVRNIIEVELTDGSKVKPANGYHIKNGAKPIMEKGGKTKNLATLSVEENKAWEKAFEFYLNEGMSDRKADKNAWDDIKKEFPRLKDFDGIKYKNGGQTQSEWVVVKPNGYYSLNASSGEGRFLPSLNMAYTYTEEEAKKLAEHLQKTQTDTIKAVPFGTPLENDPYDKFADGGKIPGSFDFDYVKFLDEMQPKIAAVLKKKGVKMNELYEISYKGHRLLPEVLSSYVDETPDKLIVGYFDKNYVPFGEFGSIEFELQEKEFHIRFPQLEVNDVEMYAKGGKSKTYMSLDEFREKLNEMSNDELLTYYCKEFGFDVNDNQIIEQVENERDSVIDELLDDYQAMMRTSGRFYAKGGWTKDYKYLNKSEDYEVRYAKGKNRKGYAEKGMETVDFDYKNKYSPLKIRNVNDVEKFFNYLMNDEKLSFHPDNKFEGNMQDNLSKEQAITLDKYVSDCFDVCEENKIDIYGLAANPMFLKLAKGGRIDTFLNKKAEEIVKYYLNDSVTPNEVFSQLELKEKGDYVIEKDGNDWFLEICFGNEYEKATTELKDNYSSFISHVENETDGKYFYDLQALTDDNLKSVMFLFEKPKYEKGGKIKTFDYKTEYNPSKIKNPNDVKEFFKYLVNVEKVNFHPDDDFDDYIDFKTKKKLFSKKEAQNLDQYMEDSFLVMDLPKNKDKEIYTIGLEVMEEYKALGGDVELPSGSFEQYMIYREKGGNISVGRLAKGKTLEEIATIHGVLVSEIEKQMDLGEKVEMEHTTDVNIARAIAKDHVFENPNYYTLLENLEKPKSKRTPPKTTRKNQPGAGSPIFALAKQIRTAGMTWKEAVEKAKEQLKK